MMSIKIERIEIEPDESLLINYKGSAEIAIAIIALENGKIKVTGPINANVREVIFSEKGN